MTQQDVGTFGRSIRWYRRLAGYTQKELAEACGMSEAAIRAYETGRRTEARAHSLRRLAAALQVTIEQLLTTVPPTSPTPPWAVYKRPHISSVLDDKRT
jgi:transcriptional regulator with XRE-family HTH domain